MRFIALRLVADAPDPAAERLRHIVDRAIEIEELGCRGYGLGERHHAPFISSAPTVMLGQVAAVTPRIRLFTGTRPRPVPVGAPGAAGSGEGDA